MKETKLYDTSKITYDNIDGSDDIWELQPKKVFLLNSHLVIICLAGKIVFTSGTGQHSCSAGSICLLVKDSICRFTYVSEDCRVAVMVSETCPLHRATTSMTNLMLFFRYYLEHPVSRMSPDEINDAISIYKGVKSISGRQDYMFRKEMCQALDVSMFYLLLAHMNTPDRNFKKKSRRQRQIFDRFIADVGKNFRQQRKLDFYANLQCITTKHLSYAVRTESGQSARQWICDHVMIEARELLSGKQLSIQEISDRLNFSDQSFFGKFFKAHEGIGPLQYQKSLTEYI